MTIITHPQASIRTYVTDSLGRRRAALVTSKQLIFNRLRDFQWHPVREFTRRISPSGFRGRITELEAGGFQFSRRYGSNGKVTHIRLRNVPHIGSFHTSEAIEDEIAQPSL